MRPLLAVLLALPLAACGSLRPAEVDVPGVPLAALQAVDEPGAEQQAPEQPAAEQVAEEDSGHGLIGNILLYLPNRVLDLFDIARFGVDVGPGIGIDVQVTELAQARALSTLALGVGLQTLRHMPLRAGPEAALGIGPLGADAELGGWYRSPADIRVGLHALLVGAHVAVEPVEILDLVLGFVFIDIKDDDL